MSSKRSRKPVERDLPQEYPLLSKRRAGSSSKALSETLIVPEPTRSRVSWIPPSVVLSPIDKSHNLQLSSDQLECVGCDGGYRMVRATHGVHLGTYFWEMEVLTPFGPDAHVRVGWSTREGELQSSVGYDKFSFGYRDISGSRMHNSNRYDNYGDDFGPGDIIGCYLHLDDSIQMNEMRFYKNGVDQGVAFSGVEIPPGVYMPAVSLYMKAHVRVNFGPSFILKYDFNCVNAVSEVQPMSIEDRKLHEQRIAKIREDRLSKQS